MSRIKHDADDSDASADRPRRPPKPRPAPPCEYVDVEPRAPSRRPRTDPAPAAPPTPPPPRCREYELMADFMSHARSPSPPAEEPPAVPPRARPAPPPPPPEPRPESAADACSTDDSLLDELQRDAYCVLKVCEDESPSPPPLPPEPFSRLSVHRKSNPTKPHAAPPVCKPLKTSSSTSNVQEAGASATRPLAERLTPSFLKRKPRAEAEGARKEDNLLGRLTPRFGQSRLQARGRSLELCAEPPPPRIARSQTAAAIPAAARPLNSSFVANLKFLSLHRYGAPDDAAPRPAASAAAAAAAASDIRL